MKKKGKFASLLKAAITYVKRGIRVVPISAGKNHPTIEGWPKLRLRSGQLKKHFAGAGAIGIILKSSKFWDVDIDCPEAMAAADQLLPETAMVHGRAGNPRSHRYYARDGAAKSYSFHDPRGTTGTRTVLIELRGNGVTLALPSVHNKTGERLRWHVFGEPAEVDAEELRRAVSMVAAAGVLARYWPEGARHKAALALAGMLLRAGWTEAKTKKFLRAVAEAASDEETGSRLHNVVSTATKIGDGQNVTGAPTLAELVGDDIVTAIRKWLDLTGPALADGDSAPHNSDLGNAQRLVAQHGENLRFCHDWGCWLVWENGRWQRDENGEAERRAKDTVRCMYSEASFGSRCAGAREIR